MACKVWSFLILIIDLHLTFPQHSVNAVHINRSLLSRHDRFKDSSTAKNSAPRALSRGTKAMMKGDELPASKVAKTILYQTMKTIGFNKFFIQFYFQHRYTILFN